MTVLSAPRQAEADPPRARRAPLGWRLSAVVDLAVLCGVADFAAWTLLYLAALAGLIPSAVAFWAWVAVAPVVAVLVVRHLRGILRGIPVAAPWLPLALCALFAGLALVIVRPDLDDASYVVRSTWIAAHGDVRVGDVIFSGGAWPGMSSQTPYLASVEALFGWLARVSGLSAGTVVYVLFPPLAAAAAVWALWMLLRAWRARNAWLGLLVAAAFLLMGGATHASWGNLHVARIWQGKVTFLALLLPLLYAVLAGFWTLQRRADRLAGLVAVAVLATAGVGLTGVAVFVLPGVVLAGTVPGLVQGRRADSLRLLAAGSGPAILAGVVVLAVGRVHRIGADPAAALETPWHKVLGAGVPSVVALLAAGVVVATALRPARWGPCSPVGVWTAVAAIALGLLVAVSPAYHLAVALIGTDAVAWRLTWVVPVPALVALVAGWRPAWSGAAAALATIAALLVGGLPLWDPANGALVMRPVAWKIAPAQLQAARWAAAQHPTGRVLAPAEVSAALGVVTADVAPVGSRPMYMEEYRHQPGADMAQRLLLQAATDVGVGEPEENDVAAALDALDVQVVCLHSGNTALADVAERLGFVEGFANDSYDCLTRAVAAR